MKKRNKIIIPIAAVIIAAVIIVPIGFFEFFDQHYIKVDSVNSSTGYTYSVDFKISSNTGNYFNPNCRYFNSTTYVDEGGINQSTLSTKLRMFENYGPCDYEVYYYVTFTGNFSTNTLPQGMIISFRGENFYSPGLHGKNIGFNLRSSNDVNNKGNTSLTITNPVGNAPQFEDYCNLGNFSYNGHATFINEKPELQNFSGRYHFYLKFIDLLRVTPTRLSIAPSPFCFITNVTLTGYSSLVYNSVDIKAVDNVTGGL